MGRRFGVAMTSVLRRTQRRIQQLAPLAIKRMNTINLYFTLINGQPGIGPFKERSFQIEHVTKTALLERLCGHG